MTRAEDFRKLLAGKDIVVMPGCFSPLSAKLAERLGFKAAYISGAALTAMRGLPDIELLTMTEMAELSGAIALGTSMPCIADADTGYGGVLSIQRTVREYERRGLAGLHLEDQLSPKRCGHLSGKRLCSPEEMVQRVIAAVDAKQQKDFLVIARTDARAVEGFDAAVERAKLYLKAGADAIFPEAMESKEEFGEFARKVKAPLLANMTEFGKSPLLSAAELQALGYRMVIFPVTALRVALKAVEETYRELREKGTQAALLPRMKTRQELYDIIGYASYEKKDAEIARRGDGHG